MGTQLVISMSIYILVCPIKVLSNLNLKRKLYEYLLINMYKWLKCPCSKKPGNQLQIPGWVLMVDVSLYKLCFEEVKVFTW